MNKLNTIQDLDDKQLLELYSKEYDVEVIGILYKRYTHLVLGVCMKYLKEKDEAEDATMQIFEKLIIDLQKHDVQQFKFWLHTISKNHCLGILRKRQTQFKNQNALNKDLPILMETDEALHHSNVEIRLEKMGSAMQSLNEAQRICIDLFYLKEKSYKEITDETGYSLNDVKSFIQNGKRNLKIMMSKTDE